MTSTERQQAAEEEIARLQQQLSLLEETGGPAKAAAQQLVRSILALHRDALDELLAVVAAAGSQPADLLLPRFAANPRVRSLLLLHDLHPETLETRVERALERLRPHLGVHHLRAIAKTVDVASGTVRIAVAGDSGDIAAPAVAEVRREIEEALLELAPDIRELIVDGLGGDPLREVPLVWAPGEAT